MAIHILPKIYLPKLEHPLWRSQSDSIATIEGFLCFGFAALVLAIIAPLSLLLLPVLAFGILCEWYAGREK